jgi:hypothetical protein
LPWYTGLLLTVAHYPPGTSKWNKIEHRMFAFITQNWRGRPLLGVQTVVSLIAYGAARRDSPACCMIRSPWPLERMPSLT